MNSKIDLSEYSSVCVKFCLTNIFYTLQIKFIYYLYYCLHIVCKELTKYKSETFHKTAVTTNLTQSYAYTSFCLNVTVKMSKGTSDFTLSKIAWSG